MGPVGDFLDLKMFHVILVAASQHPGWGGVDPTYPPRFRSSENHRLIYGCFGIPDMFFCSSQEGN